MTFKITVETSDFAGIEAIVNQLHVLSQQGAATEKKITTSTPELIQTTTEQIYPPVQPAPVQQPTYTTYPPQPVQQAPVQPPVQQVPVQAPIAPPVSTQQTYTMQELSLATRPIVEAGRQQEVVNYLHSFRKADGTPVQTIMDLPVEQYGVFATGLRQLGGKI